MAPKPLLYEKKGAIAYITFNRPEKINAFNGELYELLTEAIEDYATDDELRCAVISGAGNNFSSGGDLKWWAELRTEARAAGKRVRYDFPSFAAMDRLLKPLIAAVDGWCIASGWNVLVYSDIRIATQRAKIARGQSIGGTVAGDNYTGYAHPVLPNMNTLGNALYVGLTGKTLSAEEALRVGLISEVVPDDALMQRATELADIVAQRDPDIVQHQKELLRLSSEVPGSFLLRLQELMKRVGPRRYDNIDETTEAFLEHRNRTR